MGINHHGLNVAMTQQLLNGSNVIAVFQVLFENRLSILSCARSGACRDSGNVVIQSCAPLSSRTRISLRGKAVSCTRCREKEIEGADNLCLPSLCLAVSRVKAISFPQRYALTFLTTENVASRTRSAPDKDGPNSTVY